VKGKYSLSAESRYALEVCKDGKVHSAGQGKNSLVATHILWVSTHRQLWESGLTILTNLIFQGLPQKPKWRVKCTGEFEGANFVKNRSPRLLPHIVVRNLQPPTPEISAPVASNSSSKLQLTGSWAEYDPDYEDPIFEHSLNRWTILGIAIVIVTSGAFWAGVGLLINRLLR
jgi:hypothetical protein